MVRRLLHDWVSPDRIAAWVGEQLPAAALKVMLGQSLRDLGVALCLHRMAEVTRPTDWQPGLNMPPAELDAFIELLLVARPGPASERWLTVSFDDGYHDSAQYIASRAPRFSTVEFLFFVCPEKLELRAGFRWDEVEEAMRAGAPEEAAMALLEAPVNVATENARPELKRLAQVPEYRLSTVEEVRALAFLPNVRIGNHTNAHLSAARVTDAQIEEDYQRSAKTFTRVFGPQREFAFPFGTPRHHFTKRHVEMLRALGDFTIWSTEGRPYRLAERTAGAVLPRFPVNGTQSARQLAGWVAARAMYFRARGTRHVF